MRIFILNPFGAQTLEVEHCRRIARPDTEIEFGHIKDVYPLTYNQFRYYRYKCIDGTVDRIIQAEREGFDAVVIACMYDPGLFEARELVDIPVVGAFESSAHLACVMGAKYSIVTVEEKVVPWWEQMAAEYGVAQKLASVRHIGVSADRIYPEITPPEEIIGRTVEVAKECIEEDGAEVIVLGCTLMSSMFTQKYDDLSQVVGVPIIDPLLVAFKTAEMMVDLRQKARIPPISRIGMYKKPPEEELKRLREFYGKPG